MSFLGRIFGHATLPVPPAPSPSLPVPIPIIRVPAAVQDGSVWALSMKGLAFIESNEQLKTKAYLDSAGVPTIGYGTIVVDGVKVKMGDTITPEKALDCLLTDAKKYVFALRRVITVSQTQNQIDSLTDFTYNVGVAAVTSSSLLKAINGRQPIPADLFTRWNKIHDPKTNQIVTVAGLTARRQREFALYIT